MSFFKNIIPGIISFCLTFILLSIVLLKVQMPVILVERFYPGAGWIEMSIVSFYAGFLTIKMKNQAQSAYWRRISWLIFSGVFFGQLIIGLIGFEKFLMTGDLHFPIPAMILGGPVYRFELSFMVFLFMSTIILTGPAWCSHLCYFGAIDNFASKGKPKKRPAKNKTQLKFIFLFLVILAALILRIVKVDVKIAIALAALLGIIGIAIIILLSAKRNTMVHCTVYCPIGTIVNYFRFINPFRMYIDKSCTKCMRCTPYCNYDALKPENIKKGKPGITCTLCGDCVNSCSLSSIRYKLFGLNPETARTTWLILTISIHATFLALARI